MHEEQLVKQRASIESSAMIVGQQLSLQSEGGPDVIGIFDEE